MRSLATTILSLAVLLVSSENPVSAGNVSDVSLKIEKVYAKPVRYNSNGRATVIVTLTNTSQYNIRIEGVTCAFYNDGKPVATALGGATNLQAGEVAVETILTMEDVLFNSAGCRVDDVLRSAPN